MKKITLILSGICAFVLTNHSFSMLTKASTRTIAMHLHKKTIHINTEQKKLINYCTAFISSLGIVHISFNILSMIELNRRTYPDPKVLEDLER